MLLKLPTKPAESPEPHSHRRKLSIAHSVVLSNLDLYLGQLQGNAMGLLDSRSHHPVRRYSGCQSERKARVRGAHSMQASFLGPGSSGRLCFSGMKEN
ncbi:unnamed protein product [Gadus morhua 'NCC']